MMASEPAAIRGLTIGTTAILVSPARPRRFLAIVNLSAVDTVHLGFDAAPVAAITAGQIFLAPTIGGSGGNASATNAAGMVFDGNFVPGNAIYLISTGTATPVTIME